MLNIGDQFPQFSLESTDGFVTNDSFKEKKLVVFFYPKDNTSGCTKEAIEFSQQKVTFTKKNTKIIGVSKDSITSHHKFINNHSLKINLISDPELILAKKLGIWVEKSMYGRKYMGIERSTFICDEKGKLTHIFRKVKVTNHVEIILQSIK